MKAVLRPADDPALRPQTGGRVLVVSDAAPHRNGVGAYYQDLLHHLQSQLRAIEVISPDIVDGRWQGGWMFPLPGDRTQKVCVPGLRTLRRRIEAFAPDVVVIPTPGPFGLLGAHYARRCGARVVAGFHTWYEQLAQLYWRRVQGSLTRRYFEISNRFIFRNADVVLANSAGMAATARRIGAARAELMGTPVSSGFLSASPAPAPRRIDSVLFAGRLAAEKNIEGVLEAARLLPQVRFAIAGDGPLRGTVERAAEALPNLHYIGWLARGELMAAMDEHDALLLPSHVESFGTIALEAMARQRVVIVSEACGIVQWPELAGALEILPTARPLADKLAAVRGANEFALASRARRARRAALEHNDWNTGLWLGHLSEASE